MLIVAAIQMPAIAATTLLASAARTRPAKTAAGAGVVAASMATISWVLSPQSPRKAATKLVTRASISAASRGTVPSPPRRIETEASRASLGGLVEPLAADRVAQPVEIEAGRAAARLGAHGAVERVGDRQTTGMRP